MLKTRVQRNFMVSVAIMVLFPCFSLAASSGGVQLMGLENKEFVVFILPESTMEPVQGMIFNLEIEYFLFFESGSFDIGTLVGKGSGTYQAMGDTFIIIQWKSDDEEIVYEMVGLYFWPVIFGTGDLADEGREQEFVFFGLINFSEDM